MHRVPILTVDGMDIAQVRMCTAQPEFPPKALFDVSSMMQGSHFPSTIPCLLYATTDGAPAVKPILITPPTHRDIAMMYILTFFLPFGQSKPVARYIARKFGFMGENDVEAAQVDATATHIDDINAAYQVPKHVKE